MNPDEIAASEAREVQLEQTGVAWSAGGYASPIALVLAAAALVVV